MARSSLHPRAMPRWWKVIYTLKRVHLVTVVVFLRLLFVNYNMSSLRARTLIASTEISPKTHFSNSQKNNHHEIIEKKWKLSAIFFSQAHNNITSINRCKEIFLTPKTVLQALQNKKNQACCRKWETFYIRITKSLTINLVK